MDKHNRAVAVARTGSQVFLPHLSFTFKNNLKGIARSYSNPDPHDTIYVGQIALYNARIITLPLSGREVCGEVEGRFVTSAVTSTVGLSLAVVPISVGSIVYVIVGGLGEAEKREQVKYDLRKKM